MLKQPLFATFDLEFHEKKIKEYQPPFDTLMMFKILILQKYYKNSKNWGDFHRDF
ncbi:MAG: hypothetical protein IE909_08430 [Campylobacterales bacterium]|nr:hypothetical protein [Campylobacterales bacterium]